MTTTDILKKAFNITIRNPAIWLLAFFAAIDLSSIYDFVRDVVEPLMDDLSGVTIAVFFISVLVIATAYLFVSAITLAAMVGQIGNVLDDKPVNILDGIKEGKPYIGRIIGVNLRLNLLLLGGVIVMVIVIIVAMAIADAASVVVALLLGIPMGIGLIVVSVAIGIVRQMAIISSIETGGNGRACISRSWNLLRWHTKQILGFFFITWFIQLAVGLIIALPTLSLSAVMAVAGDSVTGVLISPVIDMLVKIIGVIVVAALCSPAAVFDYTAWTLFYRRLQGSTVSA